MEYLIGFIALYCFYLSTGNYKSNNKRGPIISKGSRHPEILRIEEEAHEELCKDLEKKVAENKNLKVESYKFRKNEEGKIEFIKTKTEIKTAQKILDEVKEGGPYAIKGGYS